MRFESINGSLTIPSKPGPYIVAPGYSIDKKNIIRIIIRNNFNNGILYSASTIEECNEIYEYCKGLVIESDNDKVLSLEDIILISTDYSRLDKKILDSKIVICPHDLLNDNPSLLINTESRRFNYHPYDPATLSYYHRSMRSRTRTPGELIVHDPRKFMIFDEIPKSIDLDEWIVDDAENCQLLIISSSAAIFTETKQSRLLAYKRSHPKEIKKFLGLNIEYPSRLRFKDGKRYDLEKKLTNKSLGSREFRLSNRSLQECLFDLLIRTKFINDRVIPEVILPKDDSYIIVDYYFPDNRLIIELDSALHSEEKDKERDEYLKSLGLEVIRYFEFRGTDEELSDLLNALERTRGKGELHLDLFSSPDINYDDLCTFYHNSNHNLDSYLWSYYDFTNYSTPRILRLEDLPEGKSSSGVIQLRRKRDE